MKNGFFRYSVLRKKSEISDEKLEGKIGPVMEVHMDANRTLSQTELRAQINRSQKGTKEKYEVISLAEN